MEIFFSLFLKFVLQVTKTHLDVEISGIFFRNLPQGLVKSQSILVELGIPKFVGDWAIKIKIIQDFVLAGLVETSKPLEMTL
jgi:hypothetical protein